jgi:hypothetical protein
VTSRAAYSVSPLAVDALPWLVRVRLRRARRKGRTGLLLHGVIRTGPRAATRKTPSVSASSGQRQLGECSAFSHHPKWAALAPGPHALRFLVSRSISHSAFDLRVTLDDGEVLVAVCEPVQSWTFYAPSPAADTWYLGIIDPAGRVRSMRPAER